MSREELFRVSRYEDCIVKYGIIAVCRLLADYESVEKYEECQLIMLAITNHNTATNQKLPTTYEGCISLLKQNCDYEEYGFMLAEVSDDVKEILKYVKP